MKMKVKFFRNHFLKVIIVLSLPSALNNGFHLILNIKHYENLTTLERA